MKNALIFAALFLFVQNTYAVAVSLSTDPQNLELNKILMAVKSNDPTMNAEALNAKLKQYGLPLIDTKSPSFQLVPVRRTLAKDEKGPAPIIGAKITDGKTVYCLPCRVDGYAIWGIHPGDESQFASGSSKTPAKPAKAADAAPAAPTLPEGAVVFACNGKQFVKSGKLFCLGSLASDAAACEGDNGDETVACLKKWSDCTEPSPESFTCSTSVLLPGGKSSKEFVVAHCAKTAFCPRATFEYGGYETCSEFEDTAGQWKTCYSEYQTWKKNHPAALLPPPPAVTAEPRTPSRPAVSPRTAQ